MPCTCWQKSPFTSRKRPPILRAGSFAKGQELLQIGMEARRRLARARGADDGEARVEPALRDRQPLRLGGALDGGAMVLLPEDQKEIPASLRRGIRRERV